MHPTVYLFRECCIEYGRGGNAPPPPPPPPPPSSGRLWSQSIYAFSVKYSYISIFFVDRQLGRRQGGGGGGGGGGGTHTLNSLAMASANICRLARNLKGGPASLLASSPGSKITWGIKSFPLRPPWFNSSVNISR